MIHEDLFGAQGKEDDDGKICNIAETISGGADQE